MARKTPAQQRKRAIFTSITVILIMILCITVLIAAFIISLKKGFVSESSADTDAPRVTDTEQDPLQPIESSEGSESQTSAQEPEETIKEEDTTAYVPIQPANGGPEYADATTLGEGTAPAGYMDELFFYGDSTTYGLRAYQIFGSKQTERVWTPSSGTLALFNATNESIYDSIDDVELSLSDIASKYKPKYLIITLGVNGIAMMDEEYFKSEYKKVIDIIHTATPETIIMLQTMYPQSAQYPATEKFNNQAIIRGNGWIHDIAAECGLKFINSYNYFLDDAGFMDSKYDNGGDGMHFNDLGYNKMLEYVSRHPYHD